MARDEREKRNPGKSVSNRYIYACIFFLWLLIIAARREKKFTEKEKDKIDINESVWLFFLSFCLLAFGKEYRSTHRNIMNKDVHRESRWCWEGSAVLVRIFVVASSSPWARRSSGRGEPAKQEERERRARQGVIKMFLLYLSLVSRRGCLRERCWRKEDREEEFSAKARLLATVRWRPPIYGQNHAFLPHFFWISISQSVAIHQSTNRECRRPGLDTATMWPFSLFFSLSPPKLTISFPVRWSIVSAWEKFAVGRVLKCGLKVQ